MVCGFDFPTLGVQIYLGCSPAGRCVENPEWPRPARMLRSRIAMTTLVDTCQILVFDRSGIVFVQDFSDRPTDNRHVSGSTTRRKRTRNQVAGDHSCGPARISVQLAGIELVPPVSHPAAASSVLSLLVCGVLRSLSISDIVDAVMV